MCLTVHSPLCFFVSHDFVVLVQYIYLLILRVFILQSIILNTDKCLVLTVSPAPFAFISWCLILCLLSCLTTVVILMFTLLHSPGFFSVPSLTHLRRHFIGNLNICICPSKSVPVCACVLVYFCVCMCVWYSILFYIWIERSMYCTQKHNLHSERQLA